MKTFITKCLFFILLLLCAFCILELRLKQIPNSFNKKKTIFENQVKDIKILILGSSSALYGINPKYFSEKGFNFANVAQPVYFDVALTTKYFDNLKNLKIIIYDVPYLILWYPGDDWRKYCYYYFWNIKANDQKWYDINNYSLTLIYTTDTVIQLTKNNFILYNEIDLNNNGYSYEMRNKPYKDNGKSVAFRHDELRDSSCFLRNKSMLEKFAIECKRRNIKLLFTVSPVDSSYTNNITSNICKKNESLIKGLCSKYGCLYRNYSQDKRFTRNDFTDAIHMNKNGAQKFSTILNEELIKPILDSI